jgi:arsenite methyltransferase
MWDAPELAELYDKVSDVQFKSGRMLVYRMNIMKDGAVLDVGCGTGRLAVHVSKMVGALGYVIGIDPSPHRIRIAEAKLAGGQTPNLSFRIGQGEDLSDYPDNTFDHLFYSSVIHWITDKPLALKEAYRVLKPGGNLGMTTVDRNHPFAMKAMMERLFSRPPYAGNVKFEDEMNMLMSTDELEGLLKNAGFQNIDMDSVNEMHHYASPDELFRFIEASSFGNFLREVPEDLRARALEDMKKGLEKMMTGSGLDLGSNTVFAMGRKPSV